MIQRPGPAICVWELTLLCNAACVHCGSSAGKARARELTTDEALALCDDLASLGTKNVTLSGGEPLLRPDWDRIAQRLTDQGIRVDLISNGLGWDSEKARRAREAGIEAVSLSIDGPLPVHDALRGMAGAFSRAMQSVRCLQAEGMPVGAVTQVSRWNAGVLAAIEEVLVRAGFMGWQLQLTMNLGRCAELADLPLTPGEIPSVARFVTEASERGRIPVYAGDNLGWMTRSEARLRSARRPCNRVFLGCQAGLQVLGITSDGTLRGCLSMPSAMNEQSVRTRSLRDVWNDDTAFAYNRCFDESALQGACASCAFRRVCRGGCKSMAWSTTGGVVSNPSCLRLNEGDP